MRPVQLARRRKRHTTRGPVNQANTEMLLEHRHAARGDRARDAELFGRLSEVQTLGDPGEYTNCRELIHHSAAEPSKVRGTLVAAEEVPPLCWCRIA